MWKNERRFEVARITAHAVMVVGLQLSVTIVLLAPVVEVLYRVL